MFLEKLLDDFLSIPEQLMNLFIDVLDMIGAVINALCEFCNMLNDFDLRIQQMTESCGSSEFTGMPIVEAIGCFRYMVGDVAFYMIYFTVLIGCILTIYKLVVLLYEAVDTIVEKATGGTSKDLLQGTLGKIFK